MAALTYDKATHSYGNEKNFPHSVWGEKERERETDRQRQRDRDRETERQRDTERGERQADGQTDTETKNRERREGGGVLGNQTVLYTSLPHKGCYHE